MPRPKCDEETNGEWMSRCIPEVMDEGFDQDAAVGRCAGMWNTYCDKKSIDLEKIYQCEVCENAMKYQDWWENFDYIDELFDCPNCGQTYKFLKEVKIK